MSTAKLVITHWFSPLPLPHDLRQSLLLAGLEELNPIEVYQYSSCVAIYYPPHNLLGQPKAAIATQKLLQEKNRYCKLAAYWRLAKLSEQDLRAWVRGDLQLPAHTDQSFPTLDPLHAAVSLTWLQQRADLLNTYVGLESYSCKHEGFCGKVYLEQIWSNIDHTALESDWNRIIDINAEHGQIVEKARDYEILLAQLHQSQEWMQYYYMESKEQAESASEAQSKLTWNRTQRKTLLADSGFQKALLHNYQRLIVRLQTKIANCLN